MLNKNVAQEAVYCNNTTLVRKCRHAKKIRPFPVKKSFVRRLNMYYSYGIKYLLVSNFLICAFFPTLSQKSFRSKLNYNTQHSKVKNLLDLRLLLITLYIRVHHKFKTKSYNEEHLFGKYNLHPNHSVTLAL